MDARLTAADGFAERDAALAMLEEIPGRRQITLGADRGYDARAFVAALRGLSVTPHVAQNTTRQTSAIDARTTRHAGYAASQRRRKRIEEVFGWMKTIGPLRKTKYKGRARVGWMFTFTAAAYNLVRMRNLLWSGNLIRAVFSQTLRNPPGANRGEPIVRTDRPLNSQNQPEHAPHGRSSASC